MKRIALALVAAVAVSACGSSGSPSGGRTRTPEAEKTFSESQLASIVLQPDQGPDGVPQCDECSTPLSIEDLAESEDERTKLTEEGFVAAHGSVFGTEEVLEAEGDDVPAEGAFVLSLAMIMADGASANDTRDFLAEETRKDGSGITTFDASSVKAGAIGLQGQMEDFPYPGRMIIWTQGNLMLAIAAAEQGRDEIDLVALARTMNANAAA